MYTGLNSVRRGIEVIQIKKTYILYYILRCQIWFRNQRQTSRQKVQKLVKKKEKEKGK